MREDIRNMKPEARKNDEQILHWIRKLSEITPWMQYGIRQRTNSD